MPGHAPGILLFGYPRELQQRIAPARETSSPDIGVSVEREPGFASIADAALALSIH
jgi:hypothetical protein